MLKRGRLNLPCMIKGGRRPSLSGHNQLVCRLIIIILARERGLDGA